MKKILICGAGGFIGSHLARQLKEFGYYVIGADLKYPEFSQTACDEFYQVDLRDQKAVENLLTSDIYEIYQLAADMGGAGYIFTGENDANIMHNSSMINLNILHEMVKKRLTRVFYSSSACMYPQHNQTDASNPFLEEGSAYPADPDSDYGWEKLFSERLYMAFARNYGIRARIARLHNVFGPESHYDGGREKSPAALCRKIITTTDNKIEIWGPGTQTRSFLYIDECIKGILKIVDSDYEFPVNLGSEQMISMNNLAYMIAKIENKSITIENVPGPVGVMGRSSHNDLIKKVTNWKPEENLENGIKITYNWIKGEINGR